jgi:hypothetical protein
LTLNYGTLEGGHQTRTSLEQSPQFNWAWGNLHNLIGGSQELSLMHHKAWEYLDNFKGPQEIN